MNKPKELDIDEVYPKLVGETLHSAKKRLVKDGDYLSFKVTGMPSCCGMAIIHSLRRDLDLDKVTDDLLNIIEDNQTEIEGIGGFVAVTSDGEGIKPKKFENNKHWKRMTSCINPGSGNTLTTWTLT